MWSVRDFTSYIPPSYVIFVKKSHLHAVISMTGFMLTHARAKHCYFYTAIYWLEIDFVQINIRANAAVNIELTSAKICIQNWRARCWLSNQDMVMYAILKFYCHEMKEWKKITLILKVHHKFAMMVMMMRWCDAVTTIHLSDTFFSSHEWKSAA